MIFLSKTSSDATSSGSLAIRNYKVSGDFDGLARISRTKLLDGNTDVSHYGATELDRDLPIDCRLSESNRAILKDWWSNATLLRISYWDGTFNGYIERLQISRDGTTSISFIFTEDFTS